MTRKMKIMLLNIVIPTLCFVVLGLLFIGGFILQPSNTAFTFTIFGFAAILFYNLITQYAIRSFILNGLLFSLLALGILMPTTNILLNLRNLNWFILIGILAYSISYVEKKNWYKDSKIWVITSWFIGFICAYVTMTILNIYVYQFYQIDERFGLLFYMKQAMKIGGVLGLGIGLGNIVTQEFIKTNVKK
jgi:hypothetical protein